MPQSRPRPPAVADRRGGARADRLRHADRGQRGGRSAVRAAHRGRHLRLGLVALGYAPDSVSVSACGSTHVGFVVDHTPICLKGALNTAVTEVDAFAGYADGTGCQQPQGGH
ncbi:hypothetical protein ACIOC1_33665 [Streptomyces sp. NPDC088197]|uniref:hypothetical protein n=1 Tax=unclassified Streptomyces TaxID=2593676 RepID=UPI0038208F6C